MPEDDNRFKRVDESKNPKPINLSGDKDAKTGYIALIIIALLIFGFFNFSKFQNFFPVSDPYYDKEVALYNQLGYTLYKESCEQIKPFEKLKRDASILKGKRILVQLKTFNVKRTNGDVLIQCFEYDPNNILGITANRIYIEHVRTTDIYGADILDNQLIEVCGYIAGEKTYQNVSNQTVVDPYIVAMGIVVK